MVDNLSDEKLLEYRVAFNMFDKNRDGTISTKELGSVLRNLGQNPNDKEIEQMLTEVDTNDNGTVEFREFITLLVRRLKDKTLEDEIRNAFHIFDKDGSKSITIWEFGEVIRGLPVKITEEELNNMIAEADTNGSGTIDCDEFVKMMSKTFSRRDKGKEK